LKATKVCSKCNIEKSASEFSPRKDRPVGLYSSCRKCKLESRALQYRERRVNDPVELWTVNAVNWSKYRAHVIGVVFDLRKVDIEYALSMCEWKCIYCNKILDFQNGTRSSRDDSPTIDRIIPTIGYIPRNITVCCHRCNRIKSDALPEELLKIYNTIVNLIQERQLLGGNK
jgi:hypothetical protein